MKKALLGGILVIGAGYVGSTMYFGSEAETQFKKSITVIDQALQKQMVDLPEGPTFQLSLKDYDKGLLNSSAKLKINLDFADMPTPIPMKNLTYDLNLNISHGPFIMAIGKPGMAYASSSISIPEKMLKMAKKQLSKDSTLPKLDLSLLINLDESSRFVAKVDEFTVAPKKFPGKLFWKGMDVYYDISKDLSALKGAAVVNGLDLDSPFANAVVSKIDMTYDLNATKYGLWVGSGTFDLPSIKVSTRGSTVFDISKLKFDSSANIHNGLLNLSMNTSFENVQAKDKSFGPANIDFEFKNLDAKSFVKVQKTLQHLKNAKSLPKAQAKELMSDLNKQLPGLFARGAQLSIKNFKFQMAEGLLAGNLDVNVPAGIKITQAIQLADHVQAKGDLQMPTVLLDEMLIKQASRKIRHQQMLAKLNQDKKQEAPQQSTMDESSAQGDVNAVNEPVVKLLSRAEINTLAQQKVQSQLKKLLDNQLLVKKSNSYIFKFNFDKGHLFINGKPFSPELFNQ